LAFLQQGEGVISILTSSPIDTTYRKFLQCVHLSSFISLISRRCAIHL